MTMPASEAMGVNAKNPHEQMQRRDDQQGGKASSGKCWSAGHVKNRVKR
jgi:hypothetical protein